MRICAVIPVHNRREISLACLDALEASRAPGFELGAILVDDGSTDGTAEAVAARHPWVKLLRGDGNLWWSGAMNLGVEAALKDGWDWMLCLNDDTLFGPELIQGLARLAGEKPGSLLAPQAVYEDNGELMQSGYDFMARKGWTAAHAARRLPGEPYAVQGLAGACALIPAAAFRAAGLYAAAALPQYHADIEFSARASRAGFPCIVDPSLRLRVRRNLKFFDPLRGRLSWGVLKSMFRWPGGVYAPRAFFAFYALSHPRGAWAGRLHAALFYAQLLPKLALNALGLGRLFK